MHTLKHAVLEELVYECIRQYDKLARTVRFQLELLASIDLAKQSCADTPEAQEALVTDYTDRAWARLAAEREAHAEEVP